MPTSIQNFFSYASQNQFSRDFLFRIKQVSVQGLELNGEDDLLYARSASLPGRDIENKQVRHSGLAFNLNGTVSYPGSEGWSIEFYVDQSLDIRKKLEQASRNLFNEATTTGNLCMPGVGDKIILDVLRIPCNAGSSNGGGSLEIGNTIELVGAQLKTIGEIAYQIADGTGEILTFSASFSYHFYNDWSN